MSTIDEPWCHQKINLRWGSVNYLEWNPAQACRGTLILLHGGGLDSASLAWSRVGTELAEVGYRVIAPDHPGFGQSPQASWVADQDRLLQYVDDLLAGLGVEDYFIGGISLGGGLAIGHSLAHQDRIRGLVLLGTYGVMQRPFKGLAGILLQLLSWVAQRGGAFKLLRWMMERNDRLLRRSLFSLLVSEEARTETVVDEVKKELRRGSQAFSEWQRSEVGPTRLKTNYTARLHEIRKPVLLLHGDSDQLVPLSHAKAAGRMLPDAQLLVAPQAGHWVQRDRPEFVCEAIKSFLRETV